jgi:hypothetical protein
MSIGEFNMEQQNKRVDDENIERDLDAPVNDVERLEHDLAEDGRDVDIEVNFKPVRMTVRRANGLQIKEGAIAQGVKIEANYQLARLDGRDSDRSVEVKDNEEVNLHDGECFVATAPDVNS